jgi:ABC-type glycerol-3-phosphate transport system substrate-binding protein
MGMSANVNRAPDILQLLMLQAGVIPWSADGLSPTFGQSVTNGNTNFNPGQDALDFYTSFANPNNDNYTWNARSDYSIDAFANGRAAFLYSYTYARPLILAKAPNLNFDVAPVPQANLDDPAVNFANYFGEVVNKQSPNSAVAWDFLKFATSKDSLDKYYATNKAPSSRKDLIGLQIQDLEIGTFANANLTAKSFYKPDDSKMDTIFNKMIDNVLLKGQSVSQALDQAQSEARVLTQQR